MFRVLWRFAVFTGWVVTVVAAPAWAQHALPRGRIAITVPGLSAEASGSAAAATVPSGRVAVTVPGLSATGLGADANVSVPAGRVAVQVPGLSAEGLATQVGNALAQLPGLAAGPTLDLALDRKSVV